MSEHIMHSDAVDQMKNKNRSRCEEIIELVKDAVRPIRDECESCEKADEGLFVIISSRKGNDVLTM